MSDDGFTKQEWVTTELPWEVRCGTLYEFIAWLQIHLMSVPVEYRKKVKIHLETMMDYGDPALDFGISYYRPMTSEEKASEIRRRAICAAMDVEEARKRYESAKRKAGLS